jgi:RNA polymerase sigma-70 factor (ECF subfamily)
MNESNTEDRALAQLMQAAQAGDAEAYARLLRAVMPTIRATVRRARGFLGHAEVEDLVQDALLSLHAVRVTYDPARPFMPWLMAIVRNRLADGARRHARRAEHEVQVEELPVTFAEDGTNNDMETYGDTEALRHAIQALPPGQRTAVEMLKLREMSLKEAAATSGMSVGALKVSVHRAMASLQRALAKG